jgi:hypothetical protein
MVEKYGILSFAGDSLAKWLHARADDARTLRNIEMWSPTWGTCEKQAIPPDGFFTVRNEVPIGGPGRRVSFNPTILCASRHGTSCADMHRHLMAAVHGVAGGAMFHDANLPWGIDGIPGGFTRSIQFMLAGGLFMPGNQHDRPIGVATFFTGNCFVPVAGPTDL